LLVHLTESQIEDYGRRSLSAAELLSVSDHLSTCEQCRGRVEKALDSDAAFFAMRAEVFETPAPDEVPIHLTVDQIAEFVDGMSSGGELQAINDHLTRCAQCDLAVMDLRAFKNQVAPSLDREHHPRPAGRTSESWGQRLLAFLPQPFQRSPLAFGSALAMLLLVLAGWLVWRSRQKETNREVAVVPASSTTAQVTPVVPLASPIPEAEIVAPAVVARLTDGKGTVELDREGKLTGLDELPPAYQRMVKETLNNQRLPRSPLLASLNRAGSSLMSGDKQGHTFSVSAPVGKVVAEDRPVFHWTSLEGATSYVIEVFDEKFNLVVASPSLTGN
jgi:anti-sigma factor RsiW